MTKSKTMSLINLLSFLIMLAINVMAIFNVFGSTTKQIADEYQVLLMPIGLTFSTVWSLIYLLLIIYTGYQLLNPTNEFVEKISIYYLITNLLNALWILSFHTKMILISTIIIIGLLITLGIIVNKLESTNMLMNVTFNIYFAWISVASVVNIFTLISSIDPTLFNSTTVRVLSGISLVVLMILTFIRNNNYAYSFTIIYALMGILINQVFFFNGKYDELVIISAVAVLISLFVLIATIMIGDNYSPRKKLLKEGK